MSIKFDHTNHKKLWNWLAENPDKNKEDWPEWAENGGNVSSYRSPFCLACESVNSVNNDERDCDLCPLIWPPNSYGDRVCDGKNGLWLVWDGFGKSESEEDRIIRSKIALQIANLPVKDGVETI